MSVSWLFYFTHENWEGFCAEGKKVLPLSEQCFSYLKKYLKPGHSLFCYLTESKSFVANLTVVSEVSSDNTPVCGYPADFTTRIKVEPNLALDVSRAILVEPLMQQMILYKKGILAGKEDPVGSFWKNFQVAASGSPSVLPADDAEIVLEKMHQVKDAAVDSSPFHPPAEPQETHAASVSEGPKLERATSRHLVQGDIYSRSKLAEVFSIPSGGAINTGVFRPDKNRFDSIWLFVTEEKTADMTQFKDLLSGEILHWQGQNEQGTDNWIIGHPTLGLEILVFYRKSKQQHPNSGFVYEGTFAYHSHELGSKPTNFILKRLFRTAPEINPVAMLEQEEFKCLKDLISSSDRVDILLLLYFVVLNCRRYSGELLHFMPTCLLFANLYSTLREAAKPASTISFPEPDVLLTGRFKELSTWLENQTEPAFKVLERKLRVDGLDFEKEVVSTCVLRFVAGTESSKGQTELLVEARRRFDSGAIPFIVSKSGLFVQIHPSWIQHFEDNADEILATLSEKILSLFCEVNKDVFVVEQLLEQLTRARDSYPQTGSEGGEKSYAESEPIRIEESYLSAEFVDVTSPLQTPGPDEAVGAEEELKPEQSEQIGQSSVEESTVRSENEHSVYDQKNFQIDEEHETKDDHKEVDEPSSADLVFDAEANKVDVSPSVSEDLGYSSRYQTSVISEEAMPAVDSQPSLHGAQLRSLIKQNIVTPATKVSLFADIDPSAGRETLRLAFLSLVNKLSSIEGMRSLCEAAVTIDDYEWLKTWLAELDLSTADYCLSKQPTQYILKSGHTNQEALGALLLLSSTELNRREGQEGEIWPLLLKSIHMELHPVMLSKRFEGTASIYVRNAIRAAIKCLNLRNVLDADDHAQFLVSAFLQFGFTRYGIRLLPTWLSRQNLTESIKYLVTDNSRNYSQSFYSLWETFKLFFQKKITKEQIKAELKNSPWVLPEWHDELVLVLANPEARFALPVPGIRRSTKQISLAPVYGKLIWDAPSMPKFELQFSFEWLGLKNSSNYRVVVNEKSYRLLRSTEHKWVLSSPIEAKIDDQAVDVEISSDDGTVVFSETTNLWEEQDVQVFDLETGKLVSDGVRLKSERSYAILASSDLLLQPQPAIRQPIPSIGRKLYLLPSGWDRALKIYLEDFELWNAEGDQNAESLPVNISSIVPFVERKRLTPGEPTKIGFRGETEFTKVESLRVSGISVPVCWNGSRTETIKAVDLGSSAIKGVVDLLVKVRHAGRLIPMRRKLSIELSGSAYWDGISWNTVVPESTLTVKNCQSNEFYFNFRNIKDAEDFALFEGNTLRHRLKTSKMKLPDVHGIGAALELRKIFNAGADAPTFTIAESIVDRGVVVCATDISASEMRIEFDNVIELCDKHQLIVWPDDSAPIFLSVEDLRRSGEKSWDFVPCTASTNLAVALAFEGNWCGAEWAEDAPGFLKRIQTRMEPAQIAAWLRWMRWPVLAKDNVSAMRRFAHTYPGETLAAWLMGEGLGDTMVDEPITQLCNWHSVTREVFAYWSPDPTNVEKFTCRFLDNNTSTQFGAEEIIDTASKLWIASPTLMARYLYVSYHSLGTNIKWRNLLDCVQAEILFLNSPTAPNKLETYDDAVNDCAEYLHVHKNFLSKELDALVEALFEKNYVNAVRRNNSHVLCSNFKGKQVLSYEIVEYLKQNV